MLKWAIAGIVAVSAGLCTAAAAQDDVTMWKSSAPFSEVIANLEDEIINHGYVIDYHGLIGDMLSRTAEDVGSDKALYREAEFFQFCSAVVSRRVMEANIANIAYCPYVIFAYEAEADPGTVNVGFRRLPPGDGRDEVNRLLEEISSSAAGEM